MREHAERGDDIEKFIGERQRWKKSIKKDRDLWRKIQLAPIYGDLLEITRIDLAGPALRVEMPVNATGGTTEVEHLVGRNPQPLRYASDLDEIVEA